VLVRQLRQVLGGADLLLELLRQRAVIKGQVEEFPLQPEAVQRLWRDVELGGLRPQRGAGARLAEVHVGKRRPLGGVLDVRRQQVVIGGNPARRRRGQQRLCRKVSKRPGRRRDLLVGQIDNRRLLGFGQGLLNHAR